MLLKLSDKMSECLAHAAEARERANSEIEPSRRADFLNMELHWLRLVESYRFVEQASRFLEDGHRARIPSPEKLPETGVLVVTCPITGKDFSTGILTDEGSLALTPRELAHSHCPHCGVEHAWWTKDAKLVPTLPRSEQIQIETSPPTVNIASLSDLLDVLVRTAIQKTEGEARAAFYVANGATLHHVTGMPEAYAKCVDGFAIGPESLACGLAASRLAKQFDYRACWSFPVRNSAGKIVGTFAMYYKEPREATQRDLDVAATITTAAGAIIARQ